MDDHAANCVSEVLAARRMVGQELSPVACPKSWWILSLWMVKKSCTKGWLKAFKYGIKQRFQLVQDFETIRRIMGDSGGSSS